MNTTKSKKETFGERIVRKARERIEEDKKKRCDGFLWKFKS